MLSFSSSDMPHCHPRADVRLRARCALRSEATNPESCVDKSKVVNKIRRKVRKETSKTSKSKTTKKEIDCNTINEEHT
jgi:hypothetical protein